MTGHFEAIRYLFIFRYLPHLDSKHLTGFRHFGLLPKPVTNELGLGILIYKEVKW